ncbi:hypothetical protein B0A53_00572 [Rhodotorula sp. CCFEE 5036]|nr:hypothetical protein B0A53_00572 [Rhodotorula sp. CCFEE 5036]
MGSGSGGGAAVYSKSGHIRNGSTLDVTLTGERLLGGADGPQKRKADANESLRKPFKAPRLNSTSSSSSEPSRNRPLAQSQRSNFGASLGQSASSSTRSPPPENSPASTPTTSSFRSSALRRPSEIAPPAREVGNCRYSLTTIWSATMDKANLKIGGDMASEIPAFAARLGQRAPTLLGADFAPQPSKLSDPHSFTPEITVKISLAEDEPGTTLLSSELNSIARDVLLDPSDLNNALNEEDYRSGEDDAGGSDDNKAARLAYEEKRVRCLTKHGEWLQTEQQRARARLQARKEFDGTLVAVAKPLERVLRRANHRLAEHKFPPPPLTSQNVGSLVEAPNTLDLLNKLQLLSPLPADHPALELVEGNDPMEEIGEAAAGQPSFARYYLRKIEWPTGAAFFGFLDDCDRFFPAESPRWTVLRDELEAQLGANRDKESPIAVPYGGMTIALTPIGRAEQDSNGILQSCMGQLLALLQHDPPISEFANDVVHCVYELVELRQPASSTLDANLPRIGNVEIALIANLHVSLNSADGGRLLTPDVSALEPFLTCANARRTVREEAGCLETDDSREANAQWSALEELAPTAPVLPEEDEQVAAHLKDELRFLQKQRASEVGLVPDSDLSSAFENIVSDASGGTTRLHGQYIEVLVSKTIFSLIDFWGLCSRHFLVIFIIFFLYRYLSIKRPTLIITRSSKVSYLFRSGMVQSSRRLFDSFLAVTAIKEIVWRETETPRWTETGIATVALVQYGPGADDSALQVATMDEGRVKYNPQAQDAAVALAAGAICVAAIARRVLLDAMHKAAIPTSDRQQRLEWLRNAKRATDELVISTGLGAYLEQARADYLDIAQRLASLRGLGYYAWHEAIVVAHGGSVADAAAHRSCLAKDHIAKQEPGPVFIGDPLVSTDEQELVSACFDSSTGKFRTDLIVDADADTKLDGTISPAPVIATRPTGTKEWVEWFIKTAEGVEMRRSAGGIDTGKGRGKTVEMRQRTKALQTSEAFVREEKKRRDRGTTLPLVGELMIHQAVERMNEKFEKGAAPKSRTAIKDFSKHPCIDAKRISLSPLFSATALLLTDSNPPKKTTTTEYIKEAGLQLVRDAVVRALPAVLVEQVESLSIYLASSANARLKHGAAIDGALVSLLSDFALSQREEMLTEAETDNHENPDVAVILNCSVTFPAHGEDRAWGGGVAGGLAKTVNHVVDGFAMAWWECGADQCSTRRLLSRAGTHKHDCPGSTSHAASMRIVGPLIPASTPILSILPITVIRRINLGFALGPGDEILKTVAGKQKGPAATALVDRAEEAFWRWRQPA